MLKVIVLFATLLGVTVAQPYISLTQYFHTGCNSSSSNFVSDVYVYPANGSCFSPTGGISYGGYYTISKENDTTISITKYNDSSCTYDYYNELYPINSCPSDDYWFISVLEQLPSANYWTNMKLTGIYGPWETVLVIDYYNNATECTQDFWIDTEVIGWQQCSNGIHFYCNHDKIHYDECTEEDCSAGCIEVYDALDDDCTASASAPTYWSTYIDDYAAKSFQATCVGGSSSGTTLIASVAVVVAALALVF